MLIAGAAAPAPGAAQPERAVARGDSLMAAHRTEDAIAAYRQGLAGSSEDPALLWKTSLALSALAAETPGPGGDEPLLEEAVALAQRAVRAGPGISRAHTALAVALGRYGRHLAYVYRIHRARDVIALGGRAKAAAERATTLDPSDFAPYVFLGVFHRELATVHPVAKTVARRFLGGYPEVSLEESEVYLRRAIELAPDDVTARLELGRTYARLEQEDAARRELARVLSLPARSRLDQVEQEEARELLEEIR
ncbi:MAG TPA: hypothetical protein VM737_07950 [Gemmatimonadota bacterium]|nr:hypothetical protein [Gemmatimonadota bacterium]